MLQLSSDSIDDGFCIPLRDATAPTANPVWAVFSSDGEGGIFIQLYSARPQRVDQNGDIAEVEILHTGNKVILTYVDEYAAQTPDGPAVYVPLVSTVRPKVVERASNTRPLTTHPGLGLKGSAAPKTRQLYPQGSGSRRAKTGGADASYHRGCRPAGADRYSWSSRHA